MDIFLEQNRKLIINVFKILMLVQIGFNLLLRGAASHNFTVPLDEIIGYSFVIGSIILITILPLVENKLKLFVKYAALLTLIGVNWMEIHFVMSTLSIQYEDMLTSLFFHFIDFLYVGISLIVFYLVFTHR